MTDYEVVLKIPDGDGDTTDYNITADLAMLYDLVVCSMDWGSGFLDEEEMLSVAKLGVLCGFDVPECKATTLPDKSDYADGSIINYAHCKQPLGHAGKHTGQARVTELIEYAQVTDPDQVPEGYEAVVNVNDGTIFTRPVGWKWDSRPKFADSVFVDMEWEDE